MSARRSSSGAAWCRSNNFYEWKKTASGKQPYVIALAARKLMALAGLWESWRSPAGERVRRFAINTTEPNELCAALHNRMPAILAPQRGRNGSASNRPTRRG
jgi:putative SOS response-associated peptidase YedK